MSGPSLDRRAFIRAGALATLGLAAAACSNGEPAARPTASGSASPSPSPSPTATGPQRPLAWRRLSASGPHARSHHSFTADDRGTIAFLFGGKQGSRALRDAWAFERSTGLWSLLPAGPAARFGHSSAFVDGHWVIFGGQDGGTFYNDAWAFDSVRGTWLKLPPGDDQPAVRYGASGTTIGNSLTISHGFSARGRFDDTWALSARWTDVTPKTGRRPGKRCLHRAEYLSARTRMVLFGGQATSTPFLNDTWLFDPTKLVWTQAMVRGPSPRNLFASGATDSTMYIFGGAARGGPLRDLWSFDGTAWRQLRASGGAPRARSAVEGAVISGPTMLVFGGHDGTRELADFWELSLPV